MSELFGIFSAPAPVELIVLLVIAVLLFGQNLPEVARSVGKKLTAFKQAMRSIENEIRSITSDVTTPSPDRPATTESMPQKDPYALDEPTAQKFDPPPE
jgi:sec-independent protein translocase protein TatA